MAWLRRSLIRSAGWRGGTRPSGESGLKVGQGESSPRAQRPRRWKKQSSHVTAAVRARLLAKFAPFLSSDFVAPAIDPRLDLIMPFDRAPVRGVSANAALLFSPVG